MDPTAKKLWIDALRSGVYVQVCGVMRDEKREKENITPDMKKNDMCVMGVLADVALRNSDLPYTVESWGKFAMNNTAPTDKTLQWAGINVSVMNKLMGDNDAEKMTFDEFANYIEKNL